MPSTKLKCYSVVERAGGWEVQFGEIPWSDEKSSECSEPKARVGNKKGFRLSFPSGPRPAFTPGREYEVYVYSDQSKV